MTKSFKLFLTALLITFFLGSSINFLYPILEDFFFAREMKNLPIVQLKAKEPSKKEVNIKARAALSVWISNDKEKILFEKNPNKKVPIASLTKLMTALVVYDLKETYDLSQPLIVSKEAINQEGKSKFGELKPGERLTTKNLLAMALIESSNDAAFALSQFVSEEGFVDLMNLYANKLNLKSTRFYNPTGLDQEEGPENYSTANDLLKLSKFLLNNYPQIFELSSKDSYKILREDGSLHHFIKENTDQLLGKIPRIIGSKTGYTKEAKGCLLIVIKKRNGYLINIILGSDNRFEEMKKLIP